MDVLKRKWKKNVIAKALMKRTSKFINEKAAAAATDSTQLSKTKSWPIRASSSPPINGAYRTYGQKQGTARVPPGYFPVYVGPERVRFVVNTKYASHPLFVMLLEDAEVEYGYTTEGPLVLPCDEDLFYKVLAEMESEETDDWVQTNGCGMAAASGFHGGYSPLTPSRLLKMNQF